MRIPNAKALAESEASGFADNILVVGRVHGDAPMIATGGSVDAVQFKENHSVADIISGIELPQRGCAMPTLVLVVGPARSGTTALMLALASSGVVARCYYQPLKALMRFAAPRLRIRTTDQAVLIKETFWSAQSGVPRFDPLSLLSAAGYPVKKIRPIFVFRHPLSTYASWRQHENVPPDAFCEQYSHCFQAWRESKEIHRLDSMTLVYETLEHKEGELLADIVGRLGSGRLATVDFNARKIASTVVWGQASDPSYFNKLVRPTLRRGRLLYVPSAPALSASETRFVLDKCLPLYLQAKKAAAVT